MREVGLAKPLGNNHWCIELNVNLAVAKEGVVMYQLVLPPDAEVTHSQPLPTTITCNGRTVTCRGNNSPPLRPMTHLATGGTGRERRVPVVVIAGAEASTPRHSGSCLRALLRSGRLLSLNRGVLLY